MSLKKLFNSGTKMDRAVTALSILLFPIFLWVIVKPNTFNTSTLLGILAITVVLSPFFLFCYIIVRYSQKSIEMYKRVDKEKKTHIVSDMEKLTNGNILQKASVAMGIFNTKGYAKKIKLITDYFIAHPDDRKKLRTMNLFIVSVFLVCGVLFLRIEISFPTILLASICLVPGLYLAGWLYHYWSPKTLTAGTWLRINAKIKYAVLFLMAVFTIACFAMAVYVAFAPE